MFAQPAASGNSLYNAMVQNQGNFGVVPGQAGTPGAGDALLKGAGTALTAKAFMMCLAISFSVINSFF